MIVNVMSEITTWLPNIIHGHEIQTLWSLHIDSTMLAQQINNSDLLGDFQKAFNNFIQSGQAWALLIGLILGYMIRGLTTYN